jgi:hypothetical protein
MFNDFFNFKEGIIMELDKKTQVVLLRILAKMITGTDVTVDRSMNIVENQLKVPVCINGAGENLTYTMKEDSIILILSESLGDSSLSCGYGLNLFDIVNGKKFQLVHQKTTNLTTLVLEGYTSIAINRKIEELYSMIYFEDLFADLLLEHSDHMASY